MNPMLPPRFVLVVYVCVCECMWACRLISADQRSSWFNHHHHQLQLITPPLYTHHFLISFVRSLFVSPGCVWSRLRSSLVHSSFLLVFLWICHVTSALVWPSKSLRHYPVSHLYRFNKERAYSHTVSIMTQPLPLNVFIKETCKTLLLNIY